jgi:hypothetical protein
MSEGVEIRVTLSPPTQRGRLFPRYVVDSNVLAVGSRIQGVWPFGVNVDNAVVFDLDEERTLANFDVHWSRSRWPRKELDPRPAPTAVADLRFSESTCRQKFFDLPVSLEANKSRSRVVIRLGPVQVPEDVVELSRTCLALLRKDTLLGFDIVVGGSGD